MIPSNQVPDGFVYVPPGVGWFGSGAEDSLRSGFFHAVPIHPVQSSGFFIARHETTHWQWLEYLRSLTGEARRARLPTVGAGGFLGSLGVIERADGSFELSLHAGKQRHRAAEGELLRLARPLRQEVDWLAMPVTGISALDAAAYAAWLRESGKVPGARLCTEVEWERAARGADRRAYPHGDSLAPNQANVDTTYDKIPEAMAPDEVGSYPASRSPFGVEDMAGNAWEWTTHANEPSRFVARGGSFYYTAQVARIENREMPEASFRDVSVGLRVCADVESRGSSRISAPNQRALLPTVVQVAEEAAEFEEKPR
jgi:formylglycine-generating enzyme required for sulfatase activity